MASGGQKKTRSQRVAAIELPPNWSSRLLAILRDRNVLTRVGIGLAAMAAMWAVTGGWAPPLRYRGGDTPLRDVVARVDFSEVDLPATERLREETRREIAAVYNINNGKLIELLAELKAKSLQILRAESFSELDQQVRTEFFERSETAGLAMGEGTREDHFDNFRAAAEHDPDLAKFEAAVKRAFAEQLTTGLIEELQHTSDEGTLLQVSVRPEGTNELPRLVEVERVRIAEVLPVLKTRLEDELRYAEDMSDAAGRHRSDPVNYWLATRLPETLTHDPEATLAAADAAAAQAPEVTVQYTRGESVLAPGGRQLASGGPSLQLLEKEHRVYVSRLNWRDMLIYTLADFGMYLALYLLCGSYLYFQQPRILFDLKSFCMLLAAVVVTIGLARLASTNQWRAELIPLVLLAMTTAIAYRYETALLLSGAVVLVTTVSLGLGLADFTVLLSAMSSSILLLGRVRTRSKLLYVGLAAAAVTALTSLGVGTLCETGASFSLLVNSLWLGFYTIIAGLLMTGLLPFIEQAMDVQTDISLLELGDAAHPLLQELVRRAPGTYNHSINVASLAEAAADSIGANGLLCRVGAYFHDIGKMLKPGYFIENQGQENNRHESLLPAMSTLVIIAHVKDGADLARQHGLPRSIIDFIQQHHGTTLVEYFYRRASQQSESDPDGGRVDESDFRYPGPKPQTREAGVMMLADSVESACRTLVEPTSSRIESLVQDIAMKRLLDGQFDESGLTLSELRLIQDSLVKSLTAVYHGRVKYPDQQPA